MNNLRLQRTEARNMSQPGRPKPLKPSCNTKREIIIPFRVSFTEYKDLIQRAGGKGKVSAYIRGNLNLKEKNNNG